MAIFVVLGRYDGEAFRACIVFQCERFLLVIVIRYFTKIMLVNFLEVGHSFLLYDFIKVALSHL